MESTLRRTWAEIDLDALAHNYRALRAQMGPEARFLGVVKADAYGHGAIETARTLEELGAEHRFTFLKVNLSSPHSACRRAYGR